VHSGFDGLLYITKKHSITRSGRVTVLS